MKTVTIQIGNTDNKLSQSEWASFCNSVHRAITFHTHDIVDAIHFSAPSVGWADWQNAAWVFDITDDEGLQLWDRMKVLAGDFRQDSIAWTEGVTVFAEARR